MEGNHEPQKKREQSTGKLKDFFLGILWTVLIGIASMFIGLFGVVAWIGLLTWLSVKGKHYVVIGMAVGIGVALFAFLIVCGMMFVKISEG